MHFLYTKTIKELSKIVHENHANKAGKMSMEAPAAHPAGHHKIQGYGVKNAIDCIRGE